MHVLWRLNTNLWCDSWHWWSSHSSSPALPWMLQCPARKARGSKGSTASIWHDRDFRENSNMMGFPRSGHILHSLTNYTPRLYDVMRMHRAKIKFLKWTPPTNVWYRASSQGLRDDRSLQDTWLGLLYRLITTLASYFTHGKLKLHTKA